MTLCPVCLEDLRRGRAAVVCPNMHSVCHDCFRAVVLEHRCGPLCPCCRTPLHTADSALFPQTWPTRSQPPLTDGLAPHQRTKNIRSPQPAAVHFFGHLRVHRSTVGAFVLVDRKRTYLRKAGRGWTWRDRNVGPRPPAFGPGMSRTFRGVTVHHSGQGYFIKQRSRRRWLKRSGAGWRLR